MKRAIIAAAVLALACARPETYRENEEFQYSRSSSDDGKKSGFYGAQRGNMGGNYEKAHNMDSLAQHQMSSVVKQVDGELGAGVDTRTGSVYNAGNSRGIYGTGQYDLSNLKGRNFDEGVNYGSQSTSFSQNSGYHGSSFSTNNARYRNQQSQSALSSGGYGAESYQPNAGFGDRETVSYTGNQRADDLQRSSNQEYGIQSSNNYRTQFRGQGSRYDQSITGSNAASDSNSNLQGRYVSSPVKFYIRPGTRTTIPLTIKSYDASQFDSSSHTLKSEQDEETILENGMNSKPKHYESSYSYKKEWEKHDTQPIAILPTENPFPKHSDLYDNSKSQNLLLTAQSRDANSAYHGFSSNSKYSNSHQSNYQAGRKTGQNFAVDSNSEAYTANNQEAKNAGEIENLIGDINSKPKNYQSSYSYHKSWERRGDPYVIIPTGNSNTQTAQRLTAASDMSSKHLSHQHNVYNNAEQVYSQDCDYDENGHIRVVRSNDKYEYQNVPSQDQIELEQQQEQQNRLENLEDLGQQTQNKWDDFENLGQTTQSKWDQFENVDQQNELEDTEHKNIGILHPHQSDFENLVQQSQNKWDNVEDLGQHSQNKWDNVEDLGQQSQNKWDNVEDLGQQSQNKWDNLESLSQQIPYKDNKLTNLGQEIQTNWNQIEESQQQTLNNHNQLSVTESQIQREREDYENLNQQSQNYLDTQYLGQQTQNQWDKLESFSHQTQNIIQHTQRDMEIDGRFNNMYGQDPVSINNLHNLYNYDQTRQSHNLWNSVSIHNPITDTSPQVETSIINNGYQNFWNQIDQENKNVTQSSKDSDNINNSETHTFFQHQFNSNDHTQNTVGSSLSSLWNKIDNFAGYTHGKTQDKHNNDFVHTQEANNWNNYDSFNIGNITQQTDQQNIFNFEFNNEKQTDTNMNNNDTKEFQNSFQKKDVEYRHELKNPSRLPKEQKIHPINIGRGDIDSEDTSTESTYKGNPLDTLFENMPSNNKTEKTIDEIESLSLKEVKASEDEKNVNSKEQSELSVIGLDHNIHTQNLENPTNVNSKFNGIHKTSTPISTELYGQRNNLETSALNSIPQREGRENVHKVETFPKLMFAQDQLEQQNINTHFETTGIHKTNTFSATDNFKKSKLESSEENLNQEKDRHEDVQQFENFPESNVVQEKLERENINQQLENIGQNNYQTLEGQTINSEQNLLDNDQSQKFEKINSNLNSHNEEQKFQDLGTFSSNNDFLIKQNIDEQKQQQSWDLETNNQHSYNSFKEPEVQNQRVTELESNKKQNDDIIVPIVVKEKPGFWKSVGNKLGNAKESVLSWFRS